MQKTAQISFFTAILININIIIGAGLFINPKPLTQLTGEWGFATYLVATIILLPLIVSIAELAAVKPSAGGLYVYSSSYISSFAGFISGWSYFLGKSTSAGLLAYTFATFIKTLFPLLECLTTVSLAIVVLFALVSLNIVGVRIGGKIQWLFITLKATPLSFVILTSVLYCVQSAEPTQLMQTTVNFLSALPTAIFALCGFEAICSISHLIKDPEKNVRRAIVVSFFIVAGIAAFFQYGMFLVVGPGLAQSSTVPLLMYAEKIVPAYPTLARILNAFVYSSIIGGSFGMLTSNCWNLYTIAKNNHLPFSSFIARLSGAGVPWASLLIQASVSSCILLISAEQTPLQNMAVFGMTISYLLSALAALKMARKNPTSSFPSIIPQAAIASCLYIASLCVKRIMTSGASYFFLIVLGIGIAFAFAHEIKKGQRDV